MNDKLHPRIDTAAGTIFINPGTGVVEGATEKNARENMKQFVKDCDSSLTWRFKRNKKADYGEGRFAFTVSCDEFPAKKVEIQMPGWELERVRFTGEDGQNIWHYPRLYVDGSSSVWKWAILDREYFNED